MNLRANCISHWKLNDNAANKTVVDSSGNGNDGEAQQNTEDLHTDGKINGALTFNGTSDFIDTGLKASEIHVANKFSICMWVKIKTIANTKMLYSADEGGADRFYFITRGDGTELGIGLSDWMVNYSVGFAVDTWYLLIVILDGTTGYIYKDNVLVGSQADITVNLPTVNTIKLGVGSTGVSYHLHCEMDVVMIFNKALTEEEIAFLWNEGNGREYLGTARPLVGGSLASGRKGLV